jgi:ubiquinone/menaquinone biosynthesis C-methylase UbiE
MYSHFSRIASKYRRVRTTDIEPIIHIKNRIGGLSEVRGADIGCGDGRYDLLLLRHIKNLHLTCIDINEAMLREASEYLRSHGVNNFTTLKADANDFHLEDDSMDCIFTFNAIHHFDTPVFLKSTGRALKRNGWVFIYTRLRSQNARGIWGQHFPMFVEKERRLYELDELRDMIESSGSLSLEETRHFRYKRSDSLENLIEKVKARHYSTFSLYDDHELNSSLDGFKENIRRRFRDTDNIEWYDENILLTLRPRAN